jgi:arylsulfatase A-like enzyme
LTCAKSTIPLNTCYGWVDMSKKNLPEHIASLLYRRPWRAVPILTIFLLSGCFPGSTNPIAANPSNAVRSSNGVSISAAHTDGDGENITKEKASEQGNDADAVETGAHHYYFRNISHVDRSPRIALSRPEGERNVLLIVVDALNASHTGVYGYERNTTPHMDAIAADGIVLTDWISNSSWTRPSFTTMITGVPRSIHGMELSERKLPPKLQTLPKKFRHAQYATAGFIGNPLIQKKWGYDNGFDVFRDATVYGDFPDAETIVTDAIEWLSKVKANRFFGVIFLVDPHAPYAAPKTARRFSADLSDYMAMPERETEAPLPEDEIAKMVAAYDDEVRYADAQIGRLMVWLKKNELFDSTVIVVTADHGEIFGAHQCYQHAYHMWEPVLRVPFIVLSSDVAQRGFFQLPATHMDLMPTLLDLAGIKNRSAYGVSIFSDERLPKTDDGSTNHNFSDTPPIYSAYDARGVRRQAARLGTLKLIRYEKIKSHAFTTRDATGQALEKNPSLRIPGPRYELFDLEKDPLEQVNIVATTSRVVELEILKKAVQYRKPAEKKAGEKKRIKLDSDTLDALRAAGYIE